MNGQMIALIRQSGLTRVSAQIESYVRDSLRLTSSRVDEAVLEVGATKLGGHPDLPPEFEWPLWDDVPQSFVAQLRLADFTKFPCARELPESGWLYFFDDSQQEVIGSDPNERGGWRVYFFDGHKSILRRRDFPRHLGERSQFNACQLELKIEATLPSYDSIYIEQLGLTAHERELYLDLYQKVHDSHLASNNNLHRVLGYPDPVQGDVHYECQLAFHGLVVGEGKSYQDPIAAKLNPTRQEWRLLLQIDSDGAAKMMWGDVGIIYYSIREQDLARRDFDQAWFTYQCS